MSKKIVRVNDEAAVQAMLDAVQGKAKVRLMDAAMVQNAVREVEVRLFPLSKQAQIGAEARISSGECLPKSYKYSGERTFVTVVRQRDGWRVVEVGREDCPKTDHGRGNDVVSFICLSVEQRKELAEKVLESRGIRTWAA